MYKEKRKRRSPRFYMLSGVAIGLLSALTIILGWFLFIGDGDDVPLFIPTAFPTATIVSGQPYPTVPPVLAQRVSSPVYRVAAATDGDDFVLSTDGSDGVTIINHQTLKGVFHSLLIAITEPSSDLFYSPQGSYLAYQHESLLKIQNVSMDNLDEIYSDARGVAVAFTPDERFAVIAASLAIQVYTLPDMTLIQEVPVEIGGYEMVLSHDGQRLLHLTKNNSDTGNINFVLRQYIIDPNGRLEEVYQTSFNHNLWGMALHPTENIIGLAYYDVSAVNRMLIFLHDLDNDITQQFAVEDVTAGGSEIQLLISHNGEWAALQESDAVHILPLQLPNNADLPFDNELLSYPLLGGNISDMAWVGDDQLLVSSFEGWIRLYDMESTAYEILR